MNANPLGVFAFSPELQTQFARLSGDWNPMHMDPIFARRTQSGRQVVHGIHTIVRALEGLASSAANLPLPSKLTVRFPSPVYVDDVIEIHRISSADRQLRLQARVDATTTADLRLLFDSSAHPTNDPGDCVVDEENICRELSFPEMAKRSGCVPLARPLSELAEEFPSTARWLGSDRIGALLCLSRLVGMECPGFHSLFSGFTIEFPRELTPRSLQYRVSSADEHFRLLRIDVHGLGVRGTVEAFARYPPVAQAPIAELSKLVARDEFTGHRVLVVGGSRGLGELTAKLIAVGGGRPTITYAIGSDDADRVAAEIKQWGAACEVMKYDVRFPSSPQLKSLNTPVSHVYYYATCQIFGRRTREFSSSILEQFLVFYVHGFHNICAALRDSTAESISVFYPSSIAVEERPRNMTEYAMAKAAAEILCGDLNRAWPSLHITTVRLPRLLTDQTSTVARTENADSINTILPIIRKVQGI